MSHECNKRIEYEFGIANIGNISPIIKVLKKADRGEDITIAFIGGSITMGSLSSTKETCYAYNVYKWMCKTYPNSKISYINAGIGATDSQFGCARIYDDVLNCKPDMVFIEFSVNDANTDHYKETYEGLVRSVLYADNKPAIMIIHNMRYDNGENSEDIHGEIAQYYDIPSVTMTGSIYQYIESGRLKGEELSPDGLHPNDEGHELVASTITYAINWIDHGGRMVDEKTPSFIESLEAFYSVKKPLTYNGYEHSVRYHNDSDIFKANGFVADTEPQDAITDIFKRGFIGRNLGDKISFTLKATGISILYRKSRVHPAAVAKLTLDGEHIVMLDSNFDEDWGDKLELITLFEHGEYSEHTVTLEITEAADIPFYLTAVIGTR